MDTVYLIAGVGVYCFIAYKGYRFMVEKTISTVRLSGSESINQYSDIEFENIIKNRLLNISFWRFTIYPLFWPIFIAPVYISDRMDSALRALGS